MAFLATIFRCFAPAYLSVARRTGGRTAGWLLLLGSATNLVPAAVRAKQPTEATAVSGELTPTSRRAYAEVLKLRLGAARELLRPELANAPTAPAPLLVANCADFADLLLSQDAARYEGIETAQEARLMALDKAPASALRDYARAEITLHLGLTQLLFKHVVMGGYHLRSGYRQMQDVVKHYPAFLPARKTLGVCQFAVGSLPEGYHWLLTLLGLTASSSLRSNWP